MNPPLLHPAIRSWPVWLFAIPFLIIVAGSWFARFLLDHDLIWRCPSIVLFSIPCPGCGGTRAFAALAEADLLGALRFNPLLICGLIFCLALPFTKLMAAFRARRIPLRWPFFGFLIALNWIYLLIFLPR